MRPTGTERPTAEILVVWAIFALEAVATLITYSRLPPEDLYHVSESGLAGGLGRTLVLVNYPIGLAAIGIVAVLLERGAPRLPACIAIVLCALVGVTVDQDDLDARAVNVLPALGVAIAVALTIWMRPRLELAPRRDLDPLRVVVAVVILVLSIPWFFAETGFYAPDPILADEVSRDGKEVLAAVHLGFHHGMGGALLALSALLLSRVARSNPMRFVVAFMFVYGAGNALQDAWHEQVVKRGWTDEGIPSISFPKLSLAWLVMLLLAAALYALSLRRPAGSAR
jgi:hypothetical protein